MTEPLHTGRVRSRLRESSWFAFGATTTALVLLASGGTAVLVHLGGDEGKAHGLALPNRPERLAPTVTPTSVTVDRVVGSFHAPEALPRTAQDHLSLASLLAPAVPVVHVPVEKPPAPQDPGGIVLPPTPPLPVNPGPQPSPPTFHPPVLPMPITLPIPLPVKLPLPLPLPLPTIPIPGPPGS